MASGGAVAPLPGEPQAAAQQAEVTPRHALLPDDAKRKRTESPNTRRKRDGSAGDGKRRRTTLNERDRFPPPELDREVPAIPGGDGAHRPAMDLDNEQPALDPYTDTAVRHLVIDAPDHPLYRNHLQTLLKACRRAPRGLKLAFDQLSEKAELYGAAEKVAPAFDMIQDMWAGIEAANLGKQISGREALVQAVTSLVCSHAEKGTNPIDLDDVLEDVKVSSHLRLGKLSSIGNNRTVSQPSAPLAGEITAHHHITPIPNHSPPSATSALDTTANPGQVSGAVKPKPSPDEQAAPATALSTGYAVSAGEEAAAAPLADNLFITSNVVAQDSANKSARERVELANKSARERVELGLDLAWIHEALRKLDKETLVPTLRKAFACAHDLFCVQKLVDAEFDADRDKRTFNIDSAMVEAARQWGMAASRVHRQYQVRVDGLCAGDLQMMVAPELNEQRRLNMIAYSQVRGRLSHDPVVSAVLEQHMSLNAGLRLGGPVLGLRYGVFVGGHKRPLPTPPPPAPPPLRCDGIKSEEVISESGPASSLPPSASAIAYNLGPAPSDPERSPDEPDSEESEDSDSETGAAASGQGVAVGTAASSATMESAVSIAISDNRSGAKVRSEAQSRFDTYGFLRVEQGQTIKVPTKRHPEGLWAREWKVVLSSHDHVQRALHGKGGSTRTRMGGQIGRRFVWPRPIGK